MKTGFFVWGSLEDRPELLLRKPGFLPTNFWPSPQASHRPHLPDYYFLQWIIFIHPHTHDIYILWSTWRRTGGAAACKQLPTKTSLSLLFMRLAFWFFFIISKVILPSYWLVYRHNIALICLPMRFAVLTLELLEAMRAAFQPDWSWSCAAQILEWRSSSGASSLLPGVSGS